MVGLPWLEIFAGKGAWASCDSGLPRRFGTFLWGNGNLPSRWTPEGEGAEWTLSDQLQPLAALQHKITVLSGYSIKVDNTSPHWSGAVGLLTGQALLGDDDSWDVAAPTIDQVIADVIGLETIFRSLEIGVESESCFSYTAPGAQNSGEDDPVAVYERIFGETFRAPGEEGLVDPRLGWRRSALDAVMTDISELESLLGAEDRVRLETHLDGLRQLETRLARLEEDPPDLESCARPAAPEESYPDIDGRPQMSVRSRVMADMLAMALACDQTRVFTFQFSRPLSPILYPEADDGHHSLTHNEADDQPTVHAITLQIMEEFAYLLGALDAVSEGEGTLLDNCAILAASEVSEGKTHSLDEIPMVVAGGACGALNMGLHLRSYAQDNVGRVMISLLRGMDVDVSTWGADETEVDDGISDLEGE
jgi:hypothetical protein